MELKANFLKWFAGRPVVILNKKTAEKLGANVNERISLKSPSQELLVVLDIASGFIKEDEIAVSMEVREQMNLKEGETLHINLVQIPKSLEFIRKKMDGSVLEKEDIKSIIRDIVKNRLSEAEISFFISSIYKSGMSLKETSNLIEAILENGQTLKLNRKIIADKHCIGGIAGNRTTPLIISICASAGLTIPKTSSRAITSAAGTADVIETISSVDFTITELKKIIDKTNAFMVWGGSLDLVPADSEILRVEKLLRLDVPSLLLASILSKKISVGSTHVIIDIPFGQSAKVSRKKALKLKNDFETLGRYFKIKIKCILTNGEQPIGNGIGPVLELIDILKVLQNKEDAPADLKEKSLFLSGQLFELTGKSKKGEGIFLARNILQSGGAFDKFKKIIEAQGGKISHLHPGEFQFTFKAEKNGKIKEINNKKINELARIAGCPSDKASGLYLYHHLHESVDKGEDILTIYSLTPYRLKKAKEFYEKSQPIIVG